jgi:hypothetical protein
MIVFIVVIGDVGSFGDSIRDGAVPVSRRAA